MYREDLILPIKSGDLVKENMELLYTANLGLFIAMGTDLQLDRQHDLSDFLQIAYIALDTAVKVYKDNSGFPFISYFRKCLLHERYMQKMQISYPFKLNQYSYKNFLQDECSFVDIASVDIATMDLEFERIEQQMLKQVLWQRISYILSDTNSYILQRRFIHNDTLVQLAAKLNIGSERVRLREKRSLNKLRNDTVICEIARDYFLCGNTVTGVVNTSYNWKVD